jgi:hypothetical protein
MKKRNREIKRALALLAWRSLGLGENFFSLGGIYEV